MKDFRKLVGERIVARRKELGMNTQSDLAQAMKIKDRTRIGKWEAGRSLPTGKHRQNLLSTLRLSEEVLFAIDAPQATISPEPSIEETALWILDVFRSTDESGRRAIRAAARAVESRHKGKNRRRVSGG